MHGKEKKILVEKERKLLFSGDMITYLEKESMEKLLKLILASDVNSKQMLKIL